MTVNPIIAEIRQVRDKLAQESGHDVRKFMDFIRKHEREAVQRGVKFAAPAVVAVKH